MATTDVIGTEDLEGAKTIPIAGERDAVFNEACNDHEKAGSLLVRILSRIRSDDNFDPGPPPDGGLRAWSIAFAAHLIMFNTWGVSALSHCNLSLC